MRTEDRRVVITGLGMLTPIGHDLKSVSEALQNGLSGVQRIERWGNASGLSTRVAALVAGLNVDEALPRKLRRSMGRVAQLATLSAQGAMVDSGLNQESLDPHRLGLAIGSTVGSASATHDWYKNIIEHDVKRNNGTSFLKVMSHTCAANVALAMNIRGRVFAPASACTSSSQSIGLGCDQIRSGAQDVMLCGGAEEVHFTTAGVFDRMGAASSAFNDEPTATPRPFDKRRDGMVVGEGGCVLSLESLAHANARGARIYAEIIGYATNCDGQHIVSPAAAGMADCMKFALKDAGIDSVKNIDYINAHATGTMVGDAAEAEATRNVFGDSVPVASTKGFVGHTLGACGAIETAFLLAMLKDGFIAPTKNFEEADRYTGGLRHVVDAEPKKIQCVLNNNFAFGGINTSLVLRRL